jgi:hypothetical protein
MNVSATSNSAVQTTLSLATECYNSCNTAWPLHLESFLRCKEPEREQPFWGCCGKSQITERLVMHSDGLARFLLLTKAELSLLSVLPAFEHEQNHDTGSIFVSLQRERHRGGGDKGRLIFIFI